MRATHAFRICLIAAAAAAGATPVSAASDRIFWNDFEAAITSTAQTWTWVPFSGAMCGDGSSVGIGVNLTSASARVLVYMEGGGACWSEVTCYTLGTAANFTTGYSASQFAAEAASAGYLAKPGGFFDRTAAANPFKDYSYVYVPYCTGDEHAGNNIVAYGSHIGYHVGFKNMNLFLARLADTFPGASRIVLAGTSAGGFGATLNWWQTQQAFPNVRVDMIDDSGAFMPEDVLPMPNVTEQAQRANWNLAATLPPGCTTCAIGFDGIFGFYASVFPNSRGALLIYDPDSVLPNYFGISASTFTTGLSELETAQFNPNPHLRYFNATGPNHVLFLNPTLTTSGVTLQQFITQMVTDDPNWINVHP